MKKIIEKAKQILHDADSGSDECKHYNDGFLDGIKFAERELKNCNLQNVMPMLRQIAEYIDCGIEMANETKEWDEIHEIIEFIHGIAEDNHMFIRN